MIKTNEHNVSFNDLAVDTAGLQALLHAGIKTSTEIGVAAGARIDWKLCGIYSVRREMFYLPRVQA